MKNFKNITATALLFSALLLPAQVSSDSVAQVQTAKRISRSTVVLLDPQGRPGVVPAGTDTAVQVGDILTFVIQFTPVPNGATRGLGGYITDYIPRGTEVVGARIIDRDGNTIPPNRGGFAADGVGPRGSGNFTNLPEGSLSQLYADTGVFFSTSLLTQRIPDGSQPGEAFLSLFNGIEMDPKPTGSGQLDDILGAGNVVYAHNQWDWIQTLAFGVGGGAIGDGNGNTPHLYGSAVAGPQTWYPYEATHVGAGAPDTSTIQAMAQVGPWQRVQTFGQEIGRAGEVPDAVTGDMPDPGISTRIGEPAVDANGNLIGHLLSPSNPLPSYDSNNPNAPFTTAVRFALGELVVGQEYFAEISLRVKSIPLDPISGLDVNCAEVFGGDASSQQEDGSKAGKDNAWRYFLPAPSCVVLNNFFELAVDKLTALNGDTLTYTIEGKNLSILPQTNVVVRQCVPGTLNFVAASGGGVQDNAGCPLGEASIRWDVGTLAPGQDYTFTTDWTVGGGTTAFSRAIYTSDLLPDPGFSVVAMTNIRELSVIGFDAVATPDIIANPPGTVTYDITISNTGTGDAAADTFTVTLPTGFTYKNGTSMVDGNLVADPAITGDTLLFTAGLADIVAGGSTVIQLQADVPAAHPAGAYILTVDSWFDGAGGKRINDSKTGLAEVLVGVVRSDSPIVDSPIISGATRVTGTTNEVAGSIVDVQVNGVPYGSGISDANGVWMIAVPQLFGGQNVTATVTAPGELESLPSAAVLVAGGGGQSACSDGIDNDADMLIDFPDDPGCLSAADPDETDEPECSDGVDNDGDNLVDYPDDPKCAHFRDDTESGEPECNDGIDNDGDGVIDTADSDCENANDATERGRPACSNGLDDDNDGAIDYPFDFGCSDPLDDDETDASGGADGGGGNNNTGGDAGQSTGQSDGGPINPGGVPLTNVGGGTDGGCCSTTRERTPIPFFLFAFAMFFGIRLKKQR